LRYILLIERYIYDAGTPVVFGSWYNYYGLEILNGTDWEVIHLPFGNYKNTMVQLPCPVN
jgi:hypothetical protein